MYRDIEKLFQSHTASEWVELEHELFLWDTELTLLNSTLHEKKKVFLFSPVLCDRNKRHWD